MGALQMVDEHPFVERIRFERAIVSAVNRRRPLLRATLVGTSEKAIARWFEQIPDEFRGHRALVELGRQLREAGQFAKLTSSGSHRGAMVAESAHRRVRDETFQCIEETLKRVEGCIQPKAAGLDEG